MGLVRAVSILFFIAFSAGAFLQSFTISPEVIHYRVRHIGEGLKMPANPDDACYLCWIKDETCVDPFTDGYIGLFRLDASPVAATCQSTPRACCPNSAAPGAGGAHAGHRILCRRWTSSGVRARILTRSFSTRSH